jgi:glycogen(starch) synthase
MTRAPAIFASSFYPHVGGVEEAVRQLAGEQFRRGLNPVVVTNRYPKTLPAHERVAEITVSRYAFRVPGAHWRHLGGWVAAGAPTHVRAVRELGAYGADLVHVQCVSSNASYALSSSRVLGVPLVVTMQGELTMDASQAYQRSSYLRRLWRRSLDAADVITGCSQFVLDEAEAVYGSFSGRARAIPNGIRLSEYAYAHAQPSQAPYVLGLGRMVTQKGFDLLIESFRTLGADWPELRLLLAGDGPARAVLESQVERTGLASRVVFCGSVRHESAIELLQNAEVFVLPSRHEPQGIVVLEAMAAGTPVVAAAVGGVPEIVCDGENGLLFCRGDTDALAAAVDRALTDDAVRAHLIAAGRATAASYDWTLTTDAYLAAYADASR